MDQFHEILVPKDEDLCIWLASLVVCIWFVSLVVGACGVGVILWGASIAALWLGRNFPAANGAIYAKRPVAAFDYDNPIFMRNLGQCVGSNLQAIMIGPNSQLHEVLGECTNLLQVNMDRGHETQMHAMQDLRKKVVDGHKQLLEKVGLLVN